MKTKGLWLIFAWAAAVLNIFVGGEKESLVIIALTVACVLFYHLARIIELLE